MKTFPISKACFGLCTLTAFASAFSNTSPVVVISNEKELQALSPETHEWSVDSVFDGLGKSIGCGYDAYVLASQSGVQDDDINPKNMPFLAQLVDDAESYSVYSTLLSTDNSKVFESLSQEILNECGAKEVDTDTLGDGFKGFVDTQPRVIRLQLDGSKDKNDKYLRHVVELLPTGNFVVVYLGEGSSQGESKGESKSQDEEHYESKGTLVTGNVLTNSTSLFANYQFFSPGIFMTGLVTFFLIFVFMVALSWLQSLKISYLAFEGEKKN